MKPLDTPRAHSTRLHAVITKARRVWLFDCLRLVRIHDTSRFCSNLHSTAAPQCSTFCIAALQGWRQSIGLLLACFSSFILCSSFEERARPRKAMFNGFSLPPVFQKRATCCYQWWVQALSTLQIWSCAFRRTMLPLMASQQHLLEGCHTKTEHEILRLR